MENKDEIDFFVVVFIGTLGILVLMFFIIFIVLLYQKRMLSSKTQLADAEREHQKKLLEASLDIAEMERQKIAANLHDEVGLNLSLLKINFSKLSPENTNSEPAQILLANSYALIENSMEIVRGIQNDIRPRTLISLGLVAAMKQLVREITTTGVTEAILSCKEAIKIADKNSELQLYRLLKEVLNNTLRHAKPTFIEINIENIQNELRVIILHNGMGVTTNEIKDFAKTSKGLGLKSIFTRVDILKAKIDFLVETSEIAKVVLIWPLI